MWREMAMFIKSHMQIQRLSLNIGGLVPEKGSCAGPGNYNLGTAKHPEIDELLVLPPLERLGIRWAGCGIPDDYCNRHGAWCFDTCTSSPCYTALQSLAVASFIKSFRERLLASGQQLGLSQIRGGLVFDPIDQQDGSMYIMMETDDSCGGTSHLVTQQASHLTNNNDGSHITGSPRWPGDDACMEVVSDDFHASLRHSKYLARPAREEVTFHFVWLDGLSAPAATQAVDCEDYWRNKLVQKKLGLNIAAPHFETNDVKKGYEADPRNFIDYNHWKDRLRHLLQFPRWALQFGQIFLLPRAVDRSELDLNFFSNPAHHVHYLGGPNRLLAVPDTDYHDLQRAISYGEADQTIFFTCQPAWPCFVSGDMSRLWDSLLHAGMMVYLDRNTGLLLEY